MRHRSAALLAVFLAIAPGLLSLGCKYANTDLILNQMNSGASCPAPKRASARERASRIVFASVADAYLDRDAVLRWLDAAAANPEPLMDLYRWTLAHPHASSTFGCAPGDVRPMCAKNGVDAFRRAVLPQTLRKPDGSFVTGASAWGLPAPAVCLQPPLAPSAATALPVTMCDPHAAASGPPDTWRVSLIASPEAIPAMVDAERFVSNLASVPGSLVALHNVADPAPSEAELRNGIVDGLEHARRYLAARAWHRTLDRPRTALALSGGAGTGAFEAGFVNRLLGILERCRANGTCKDAGVDLVVGTSTGSLVGVLVDMFSTYDPALEARARKLLRDEYTCTVEPDLYCRAAAPILRIATDVPGLVQFDGIESLLRANLLPELGTNATELVTMTVDYESGDLFAESDQDPDIAMTPEGRVESVLASIVEPLMAYPITTIHRANGTVDKGTFIDGGIRSGLPVLEAMRRGAERVIAISTASIDPDPVNRPHSAVKIVLRTIDLLVDQPRVSEIQQADLAATSRRMAEYNLCVWRYQVKGQSRIADEQEIEHFCRRTDLPTSHAHLQGATAGWTTPEALDQVSSSWQSSWVFRSEKDIPGMDGYSFDPVAMRRLYLQGVDAFQDRCQEMLDLFALPPAIAARECARTHADVEAEEQGLFANEATCEARTKLPRRTCATR